ncbi:phytanoyl-CoA dioxygenase family protein [Paraglaciecola arctica]|uniref:phytanoyl-CoA dioxygenase family protein n=1 Tax=Paraglaciecola arctica TaxID=1128911 RepID=UPI001C0736C4|nr:phytanoyl-CoA dioxygenase family protein [Paraglaciecola arctica]MBU3002377.1 phytanoyl-CoA dioxygenase family protein [Paraglaciecola arctica]
MTLNSLGATYRQCGVVKLDGLLAPSKLGAVKLVAEQFHRLWCADNYEFYTTKAINSSGLTSGQYLTEKQRLLLFKLVSHRQLVSAVKQVIPQPLFVGTQLFFDPVNPKQPNYWHRDPQYDLSIEDQKLALEGPEPLHVRIPLTADPGIEVIPGSHKTWDSDEELQVRLELNGHKNSENLPNGIEIPLQLGDILIFSANMIHRGLYGNNRLVLDLLYCQRDTQLTKFIQVTHQPTAQMLPYLDRDLFL